MTCLIRAHAKGAFLLRRDSCRERILDELIRAFEATPKPLTSSARRDSNDLVKASKLFERVVFSAKAVADKTRSCDLVLEES